MSKNYAIIIQFVLPLTTFYQSGAQRSNVYKRDAFMTSWRSHNRAWQPQRHDRLSETSGTWWIPRGALTNQRCSLATECGINMSNRALDSVMLTTACRHHMHSAENEFCWHEHRSALSVDHVDQSDQGNIPDAVTWACVVRTCIQWKYVLCC